MMTAFQEPGQIRLLRPKQPFRFDLALAYLGRSPREILDRVEDSTYRRAVLLAGEPRLLKLIEEPDGALNVSLADGPARFEQLDAAAALVERCFRIHEDVRPLDELSQVDPRFGLLVQKLRGLRALLMVSPFEALVWAIIGQQINVRFAYKLKKVLVEQFGERLELEGETYYLFPTAEKLAELDPAELRALQFSGQKIRYIQELARLVARGELDLDGLASQPLEEARARLLALNGVGRWTAEYALMRGLGARDELPAADIGLQIAASRVYGLEPRPTESELRALAETWTGWRSYYAFYLWFSLVPGIEHLSTD